MLVWTCALRYFAMAGVATHPEGICDEFARNCDEFARNLFLSFLDKTFFENFRQNPCTFQSYCLPLPSLQYLCGAFHILCGYAKTEYGGSPSTCFLALSGGSHECCSRRGRTSRFFRTLSSTVPDGIGHKATTYTLCKQLHQFSAQLICAR